MQEQTQAAAAIARYFNRQREGQLITKFRAPPSAKVQHGEDGAKYPRFIRFSDGSSARVDQSGDVQEF